MKLLQVIILLLAVQAMPVYAQDGNKKKKKKDKSAQAETPAPDNRDQTTLDRLFLDAEKARIIEDWETAIDNYNQIIAKVPGNANVHFQLAQIYFNQNKLDKAEIEAATAAKLDDTNKWYLEMLATVYSSRGKAKEAGATYEVLIKKFPNNPDYYLNLGYLYSKFGQYENAVKVYDQFEKNFGLDEQVVMEKKNLYLRMNKFNEAMQELDKLVQEFPEEADFWLMKADLYRAKGEKEKAREAYNRILQLEPDNPQAQIGLAQLNAQSDTPEQKKENLKGIFENPKVGIDTKVSILLISYIQMNSEDAEKRKEALDLASILVSVHPEEAKAHAIQADLYYLDGQDDKALESYNKALAISKDVFQVWQQVMAIYSQKQNWEKVMEVTGQAMELFPNQAMIYLFRGGAEMQLKDFEKAVRSFSKGEKMSAENLKLRAQFLANQGDAFHSLNKNEESDAAYDKALKLDPENAYVLNNYSYYLSLRKANLEKAQQMSAYANKLEPDNASFLDTYAWILFQQGKYADALEWQAKALKAGGDKSGTVLEHYGDILYKLGKKAEALEYWKKAKETGVEPGMIDQKIAGEKYIE